VRFVFLMLTQTICSLRFFIESGIKHKLCLKPNDSPLPPSYTTSTKHALLQKWLRLRINSGKIRTGLNQATRHENFPKWRKRGISKHFGLVVLIPTIFVSKRVVNSILDSFKRGVRLSVFFWKNLIKSTSFRSFCVQYSMWSSVLYIFYFFLAYI